MVFGLDTSASADLITEFELEPSAVGEVWEADPEDYAEWSQQVKQATSVGAHVDEEFSEDDFGYFLTA